MSEAERSEFRSVEEVPDPVREDLGELLLVLADNKRVLGMRYADWILGAPSLEAGISCSAMAQDEWGHGRIFYSMLKDFGHDADHLEHERKASDYRNLELLDDPIESWPGLLAANLLVDSALSVQFESMRSSRFQPIHYKVAKLLEEERYHLEHARGWTSRMADTDRGREALRKAFTPAWEACLRWFGPSEDERGRRLAEEGVTSMTPDELRARWLARVGPPVERAGLELVEREGENGAWRSRLEPAWDAWSSERRRGPDGEGPDPDTLARIRGDRNRALLLD